MSLKKSFELLAKYNQRMNSQLYQVASCASDEVLSCDSGIFFGSLLGTFNHILVGDVFWLKRFAKHPANFSSLEGLRAIDKPKSLDAILYAEWEAFGAARKAMDEIIVQFSQEITDDQLASFLTYKDSRDMKHSMNLGYLIQHLFNHQTHHRGQVTAVLHQLGLEFGVTDLLMEIDEV